MARVRYIFWHKFGNLLHSWYEIGKVYVFWEGHKIWQCFPSMWLYVVSVKSTVKISSIFVAFLENMDFTKNWIGLGPLHHQTIFLRRA